MSDLISKAEVLSLLESMMETYWDRKQILSVVRSNIEKLPSAEKKGRWIVGKYPLYTCSECEGTFQDVGYGFDFCPNCGARMEEDMYYMEDDK